MARFYQNVLTGQQVEVKTFDEEDFYLDNQANWCRIKALSVPDVPGDLKKLKLAELKSLARSLGQNTDKAKTKKDVIALIQTATPEPQPDQKPPEA